MKKAYLIFVVLSFIKLTVVSSVSAQAPGVVSVTGHIVAEVVSMFTASETSELYFGKFSPGPQGGEIILTPDGTISTKGSVFKGVGTHSQAAFYITGDLDATFSISLPKEPEKITNTTNSKTMLVSSWMSTPVAGLGTGKLENGCQTIYVGATLMVGTLNDNPPGLYTGSYTITFDFN